MHKNYPQTVKIEMSAIVPSVSEALLLKKTMLADVKRDSPDDHPKIITAMNNLAISYSENKCYKEAVQMHVEVLKHCQKFYITDELKICDALYNLAITYVYAGKYDKSLLFGQKALASYRKLLPQNHPIINDAMRNLAVSYCCLDMHEQALGLVKQLLALSKRSLQSSGIDRKKIEKWASEVCQLCMVIQHPQSLTSRSMGLGFEP